MKNKFLKVFFISLSIFLFSSVLLCSAAGSTLYTYDDRVSYITYTNRTVTITSVGYDGTASRLARANTASFDFVGSTLIIHAVSYTNSGRARIYIDGQAVGYSPAGVTSSYTPLVAYSTTTLSPGKHTCSIEAWDSTVTNPSGTSATAYFFLDYIELDHSLDQEEFFRFYIMAAVTILIGIIIIQFVIKYVLWRLYPDD